MNKWSLIEMTKEMTRKSNQTQISKKDWEKIQDELYEQQEFDWNDERNDTQIESNSDF